MHTTTRMRSRRMILEGLFYAIRLIRFGSHFLRIRLHSSVSITTMLPIHILMIIMALRVSKATLLYLVPWTMGFKDSSAPKSQRQKCAWMVIRYLIAKSGRSNPFSSRHEIIFSVPKGRSTRSPGWSEAEPWVDVAFRFHSPERAIYGTSPLQGYDRFVHS